MEEKKVEKPGDDGLMKSKKLGAKKTSLIGMIFGALWIVIWGGLKFTNTLPIEIAISDIIYSGLTIAGLFAPVTISIILDKIKDIKLGGK